MIIDFFFFERLLLPISKNLDVFVLGTEFLAFYSSIGWQTSRNASFDPTTLGNDFDVFCNLNGSVLIEFYLYIEALDEFGVLGGDAN